MRRLLRKVAEPITWVSIGLQFAVAFYFLYFAVTLPPSQFTLALVALAVAFASTASTGMYNVSQTKKIDKILQKLDEIRKPTEHTLVGEALATVVDNLITRKTGGNK